MPLATVLAGANRTDMKQLGDLLDARLVPCPLAPDPADPAARPQLWSTVVAACGRGAVPQAAPG